MTTTIRLQVAVTIDSDAAEAIAQALAPALARALTGTLTGDAAADARLRQSRRALFAGETPPTDKGQLIDSRQAAKLLKVSARTVYRMEKEGEMPPAIRIGSAVRWSQDELAKWVEAGCPKIGGK